MEEFLNYLSVASVDFQPPERDAPITLTTVHKAKGQEFDEVIYLPSRGGRGLSLVDSVVEAIFDSCGIDVSEDLQENRRVDFVAMTRARNQLYILADSRLVRAYDLPGWSTRILEDKPLPVGEPHRLRNAYALFLSGDWEKARELIDNRRPWLSQRIRSFFQGLSHLSFSTASIDDPEKFLEWKIVDVDTPSEALDYGSRAHDVAEAVLRGQKTDLLPEIQENVRALITQLRDEYDGLKTLKAEEKLEVPLPEIMKGAPEDMTFLGYIDAVFQAGDRIILVDWKTSKSKYSLSRYRKQLAAYRRLYSAAHDVPEENIDIGVGFIALRPAVNTGECDCELVMVKPRGQLARFQEDLSRVLSWREDPESFMHELAEQASGWLGDAIRCELKPRRRARLDDFT